MPLKLNSRRPACDIRKIILVVAHTFVHDRNGHKQVGVQHDKKYAASCYTAMSVCMIAAVTHLGKV